MVHTPYDLGIGLSDEHTALAEAVRGFADRAITPQLVRKDIDNESSDKFPGFWPALVNQDLLGLHIPEADGGAGGGLLTLAVALEALGRTVAPGPFVPTVLASAFLSAADPKCRVELLPGLLDGSRVGTVALGEPVPAELSDGGLRLHGVWDAVLVAEHADLILLPVRLAGEVRWVAVDATDLTLTRQDSIDLVRGSGRASADGVLVRRERVLEGLSQRRARSVAAVVLGAEAAGVLSWCVATAAEYAKIRVQFGRPIGQFQAVKHKCAGMGIALEQSRAVLWDAAAALDKGDDTADFAAEIAALIVPDAAVRVAADCVQVHGGIGFTWEHDAHLYYRRGLALRALLGSHEQRAARVAQRTLAGVVRPQELELPAEADAIRAAVRAELQPLRGLDEDAQLVELGAGGWVQPHLPRPYGRGAGPLEQIIIAEQLKAAGIALPQLLMGGWAVQAIVAHGSEQQKRELVVPTLAGELVWCQLFSEPGAGSDLAALSTKAEKVDGGWKINGQKIWTTVAQFSDWAMLIARSNPERPQHEGITYFVLDMNTPGVTVRPLREMTGSALFNEVFLDDVFIPDENVVGAVGDGWHVARTTLAGERVALSQKMEAYATDRDLITFVTGRELTEAARHQLGELIAESQAVDLICARVVLKQLSGADVSTTSSVGKLLAMGLGQKIAEYVVAQLGLAGTVAVPGQPSDKAMEQLIAGRATTIYGGTTEVQLNVIGERMLGLPRDAAPGSGR
jgi:alkylation response protein AidB-like acyl-CoA dehydrogenase